MTLRSRLPRPTVQIERNLGARPSSKAHPRREALYAEPARHADGDIDAENFVMDETYSQNYQGAEPYSPPPETVADTTSSLKETKENSSWRCTTKTAQSGRRRSPTAIPDGERAYQGGQRRQGTLRSVNTPSYGLTAMGGSILVPSASSTRQATATRSLRTLNFSP